MHEKDCSKTVKSLWAADDVALVSIHILSTTVCYDITDLEITQAIHLLLSFNKSWSFFSSFGISIFQISNYTQKNPESNWNLNIQYIRFSPILYFHMIKTHIAMSVMSFAGKHYPVCFLYCKLWKVLNCCYTKHLPWLKMYVMRDGHVTKWKFSQHQCREDLVPVALCCPINYTLINWYLYRCNQRVRLFIMGHNHWASTHRNHSY